MSSARGAFLLVDESSGDTIAETRVGGLMEMGSLVVDDVVVTPSIVGLLATHSVTDGRLVSLQKLKLGLFGAAYADGLLYVAAATARSGCSSGGILTGIPRDPRKR